MNQSWKRTLFVLLNLIFAGCLAASLYIFITVLGGTDPLALLGILAMDMVFLVIGVLLVVLSRTYDIPGINKTLPFVAFLGLTLAALLNVTTASLWLGVVTSAVLLVVCVITAIVALKKH